MSRRRECGRGKKKADGKKWGAIDSAGGFRRESGSLRFGLSEGGSREEKAAYKLSLYYRILETESFGSAEKSEQKST